jgi:hypothetical protein
MHVCIGLIDLDIFLNQKSIFMNYSWNVVATLADCDAILTLVSREQADLQFAKAATEREITHYAENSVEVDAELQKVNAELAAYTTIVANLPAGENKEANITKLKRLEVRQRVLADRKNDYGVVALLDKQLSLGRIEKELVEVDAFIASLQAHKATLTA